MYLDYWDFKQFPFENSPNPPFFYRTPSHEEALSRLMYAVKMRRGGAILTGEVGCGKTALSHELVRNLPQSRFDIALVSHPLPESAPFLQGILLELNSLPLPDTSAGCIHRFHERLRQNLRAGKDTLLIIDEAQSLNSSIFEEIRLLLNFQSDKGLPLTIILVGQSHLRDNLAQKDPLSQRVAVGYHLTPFNSDETHQYIIYRQKKAGREANAFDPNAIETIFERTQGIPRKINDFCDMALMIGLSQGKRMIGVEIVESIVTDVRFSEVSQLRGYSRSRENHASPGLHQDKTSGLNATKWSPADRYSEPVRNRMPHHMNEKEGIIQGTSPQAFPNDPEAEHHPMRNGTSHASDAPPTADQGRRRRSGMFLWTFLAVIVLFFIGLWFWEQRVTVTSRTQTVSEAEEQARHTDLAEETRTGFIDGKSDSKVEPSIPDARPEETRESEREEILPILSAEAAVEPDDGEGEEPVGEGGKVAVFEGDKKGVKKNGPTDETGGEKGPVAAFEETKEGPPKRESAVLRPTYPYSIYLGSFKTRKLAQRAVDLYITKGIPSYWVKIHLKSKGTWYRVFSGAYRDRARAESTIQELGLAEARVRRTFYTNLIGSFSDRSQAEGLIRRLKELGFCPYVRDDQIGGVSILVGAYFMREDAMEINRELETAGVQSSVIRR